MKQVFFATFLLSFFHTVENNNGNKSSKQKNYIQSTLNFSVLFINSSSSKKGKNKVIALIKIHWIFIHFLMADETHSNLAFIFNNKDTNQDNVNDYWINKCKLFVLNIIIYTFYIKKSSWLIERVKNTG